jgi:GNAT superfamily N-acetyltransferase
MNLGDRRVTMSTIHVRSATPGDQQVVIDVITLAFSSDPMARWSLPDPSRYLAVMPRIALAFGGNGFAHGTAHLVDGGVAAAMWLPPGIHPDLERLVALTEEHSPKDRIGDMTAVFERMASFHPPDPCWYLPLIAVDPACQGRGYGSALLRHALAQCDRDHAPAYLESSNPRNIPVYERHGFVQMGAIQVGSSPTLVPMLRLPH